MTEVADDVSQRARFLILGTAGHIDHGKTSLVAALTGTDTDRLPEEKRRGMTIELGFAELVTDDFHYGIVDVPGHERFVRTMVAGATGIDLALIVVAGDDSVMPQTVEHVEVLRLVGIRHAVVAITKIDAVDPGLLELVEEDVRDLLGGTSLEGSPMVRVSSVTGAGIDALKRALDGVARRIPARASGGPFRMAVDRVFTVQGRGMVVTGSVLRGVVRSGDALEVQPGSARCRVREMQSHGQSRDRVQLGQRAALNLIGVDRRDIDRGHELVTPDYVTPSGRVDCAFAALSTCRKPIEPFSTMRICMGTRELFARIATVDHAAVAPGCTVFAQLRSNEPFFATYGQRFIAREENDRRTIGGGVILRPVARRWSVDRASEQRALETLRRGTPRERLTQVLTECGFTPPPTLPLAARSGIEPDDLDDLLRTLADEKRWVAVDGSDRRVVPACIDRLFERADRWLKRHHERFPDEPGCHVDALVGWLERKSAAGLGRALFEMYRRGGRVKVHGRFACLPAFAPKMSARDEKLFEAMLEQLRGAGYQPPSLDSLAQALDTDVKTLRRLAKLAVAYGQLVEIGGGIYLAAEHEARLRDIVAEMIADASGVTVAAVRERLGTSRKYAVPFMEYLDRVKFTTRRGDTRVMHEEASP